MENNNETKELENNTISNDAKNNVEQPAVEPTVEASPFSQPVVEETKNDTTTDLYSGYQSSEFSDSNSNKEASGSYHVTLLLNYFLGAFGLHRLINGKKISGLVMLLLTLFFPTIYLAVMLLSGVNLFNGEGGMAFVVLIILTPFVLVTPIMAFVDFLFIITGNFKNKTTGKKIKSGKPFFKTWSNILVIVLIVISMIGGTLTAAFGDFGGTVVADKDKDDDKDKDKDKGKDKDKDKGTSTGDVADYLELIEDCLDGDDFDIEDRDAFEDALEEYFDDLDYDMSVDNKYGYISFSKEIEEDDVDFEYELTMFIEEDEDDDNVIEVRSCSLEFSTFSFEDEGYTSFMIDMSSYSFYDGDISIYASVPVNDEEDATIFGSYDSEDDEYELEYYLDYDDDELEYDMDEDEFGVKDDLDDYITNLLDEYDNIFK